MAGKRTYGDVCGVARALDAVGERWALMIVRELLLGPKRFTDLRAGLPHLSPDILTQRLRDLDAGGIVTRRTLPPPAPAKLYELTALGHELEPVVTALGRWGALLPISDGELHMSFDAHILSLRTLFAPALAEGFAAHVQLRLGEQRFLAVVEDGGLVIEPGETAAPDAVIATDASTLIALVHGRRELDDALRAGDVTLAGDEAVVRRFLGLFPLPEPIAAAT